MTDQAILRGQRPPGDPSPGQRWRDADSRAIYVFMAGHGWVAENLRPPAEAPIQHESVLSPGSKFARRIEAAREVAVWLREQAEPRRAAVIHELVESSKGARTSLSLLHRDNTALLARIAELEGTAPAEPVAKPEPKGPTCPDCGGPRGQHATRCRACFLAQARPSRKPPAPPNHCACGAEIGEFSKQCRPCFEGAQIERAATRKRTRQVVGLAIAEQAAKPRDAAPVSKPPSFRQPAPSPPRPAPVPLKKIVPPPPAPVEPHRPLAPGEFPPEFLEKLKKVRAGAGIVEVHPIRTRDDKTMGNSSLDFT